MIDPFEDHCWKDIVPPADLELYAHYRRETFLGSAPALLAVDLYELAYQGGPAPAHQVARQYPSSCGAYAWAAVEPTMRLFAATRAAGIPIFYSTYEVDRAANPRHVTATNRRMANPDPALFEIRPEFAPQPGDAVIRKQRASAFFGTPLIAHLTARGVNSVIICGESTSGCVRATAVDAYSFGFHVVLVEECCFDRALLPHQINLFDLHHKYADVMHLTEVLDHLGRS